MITITDAAAAQIHDMIKAEEDPNVYLRVGVQGGGCSGLSYGIGFENAKNTDDTEFELHGIPVLIDADSSKILEGTVIDYKQNMMGGGFTIDNPNAIASCGCGSSFRTAKAAGTPEKC